MARVLYSAEINELKGSVGGTTFQRNKSGTIAKLKSSLVFNPTSKQLTRQVVFNQLVSLWSALSYANKLLWQTFSSTYTKYNYFGVEKNLSAFNWFLSCNSNRALTGQSFFTSPPAYITPITAPNFYLFCLSDSLSFLFDCFPDRSSYYLFVYATPPLRTINLQSRNSLRLIKVISPDNVLWHDLTTDWENYFGLTWPPATSSGAFNILCAVSCVHKDTGIAGVFNLVNATLDLSSDPETLGDSFVSSGAITNAQQFYTMVNMGSGLMLAGSAPNAYVFGSSDAGSNWSSIVSLFSVNYVLSMAYAGSGIVLAGFGTTGYVGRSTDYGQNWSNLGTIGSGGNIQAMCYLENGIMVCGDTSNGHVYRSTNYGLTWSDQGALGSVVTINKIIYLGNGICIAATTSGGKIYRSTDYGQNWSDNGQLGSYTILNGLCYLGNGVVLCGANAGAHVFRSTDYGQNWSDLGQLGTQTLILGAIYVGHGVCFIGCATNAEVFRSVNNGLTWSSLGSNSPLTQSRCFALGSYVNLSVGTLNNGEILLDSY